MSFHCSDRSQKALHQKIVSLFNDLARVCFDVLGPLAAICASAKTVERDSCMAQRIGKHPLNKGLKETFASCSRRQQKGVFPGNSDRGKETS